MKLSKKKISLIALAILLLAAVILSVILIANCNGDKGSDKKGEQTTDSGSGGGGGDDDVTPGSNIFIESSDGGATYTVTGAVNDYITAVIIPATYQGAPVTAIKSNAFYYCTQLASIVIPDSITRIGIGAFNDCSSLTKVTLPAGITQIEDDTFNGCSALESVVIPAGVDYIGDNAFKDCTRLTHILFRGTEDEWNAILKESTWNTGAGSYTVTYNYTGE